MEEPSELTSAAVTEPVVVTREVVAEAVVVIAEAEEVNSETDLPETTTPDIEVLPDLEAVREVKEDPEELTKE